MSEHITHIAVFEDLARIFLNSPDICDAFKLCINNRYDSGLLGSGTRGNHIFAVPILEMYKDNWETVMNDREVQIRMAYAIGWLTHRAADRRLKLVFAEAENDPNPAFSNDSCRIYQDAMSFRKVYAGGMRPCLSPNEVLSPATFAYGMHNHPAAGIVDPAASEPLFNRMWQSEMVARHRFIDNQDDLDSWLDLFLDRFQVFTEDFRKYEKAYNDPDPLLAHRYYEEDHYYEDSDGIIQYVRSIQNGVTPQTELSTVVEQAKNQSLYAQTLRQGWFFIKGGSDFFTGVISKNSFMNIINKQIT